MFGVQVAWLAGRLAGLRAGLELVLELAKG